MLILITLPLCIVFCICIIVLAGGVIGTTVQIVKDEFTEEKK